MAVRVNIGVKSVMSLRGQGSLGIFRADLALHKIYQHLIKHLG